MVEIKTAKSAGFCFGVKRAVDQVYELSEQLTKRSFEAEENKEFGPGRMGENGDTDQARLYTYGPIIHNEQVVDDLAKRGVEVINSAEELSGKEHGTIVIRSHGISETEYEKIRNSGHKYVDATCPFVKRIHDIVQKESESGSEILILGSPDHPEVEGIMGWCHGPVQTLDTTEKALNYEPLTDKPICLVSQTTFNYKKFEDIVEILAKRGYNMNVMNTICNATSQRQNEAEELAEEADVMIVIGGKHSSNTRKLYEICAARCEHTFFIQTLDDLHLEVPKAVRLVGITAGASTPQNIIEEVQKYVRIIF